MNVQLSAGFFAIVSCGSERTSVTFNLYVNKQMIKWATCYKISKQEASQYLNLCQVLWSQKAVAVPQVTAVKAVHPRADEKIVKLKDSHQDRLVFFLLNMSARQACKAKLISFLFAKMREHVINILTSRRCSFNMAYFKIRIFLPEHAFADH